MTSDKKLQLTSNDPDILKKRAARYFARKYRIDLSELACGILDGNGLYLKDPLSTKPYLRVTNKIRRAKQDDTNLTESIDFLKTYLSTSDLIITILQVFAAFVQDHPLPTRNWRLGKTPKSNLDEQKVNYISKDGTCRVYYCRNPMAIHRRHIRTVIKSPSSKKLSPEALKDNQNMDAYLNSPGRPFDVKTLLAFALRKEAKLTPHAIIHLLVFMDIITLTSKEGFNENVCDLKKALKKST